MMISPAYAYEKAPDQEHFLGVEQTRELFRKAFGDKPEEEVAPQPLPALPRLSRGQGGLPVHGLGRPQLFGLRLAANRATSLADDMHHLPRIVETTD